MYVPSVCAPTNEIAKTIDAAAPALIPISDGSASGFRVTPWRIAPERPSAAPAVIPRSVRGTRISRTTVSAGEVGSKFARAFQIVSSVMSREPCVIERKHTTSKRPASAASPTPSRASRALRTGRATLVTDVRIRSLDRLGQRAQLLGVVAVRVQPVRRPLRVRAGRERLDRLRDRLRFERLEVPRVVAVVEQEQVGLVVVGLLEAERLPVRELGVRL